jgi:hypothetical protein
MDALTDTPRYTFGHRPDLDKPNNMPGIVQLKKMHVANYFYFLFLLLFSSWHL